MTINGQQLPPKSITPIQAKQVALSMFSSEMILEYLFVRNNKFNQYHQIMTPRITRRFIDSLLESVLVQREVYAMELQVVGTWGSTLYFWSRDP